MILTQEEMRVKVNEAETTLERIRVSEAKIEVTLHTDQCTTEVTIGIYTGPEQIHC